MTNAEASLTFHRGRKPAEEASLTQQQIQTLKGSISDSLYELGQRWEPS